MALSPNYGWSEPDNSSLVKNGAQDIRALGDAVDTAVWNVGFGQAGKNAIINGDFAINQRNFTSVTPTGSVVQYGFDRWRANGNDGTVTYSAQTFTVGTAPVAGYEAANFARVVTTGQTITSALGLLGQAIEDVRTFAGQTVTVSFWAKAGTGTPKIAVELDQQFGSGGSTRVATYAGQVTLSTSWARYSVTVAVPSISGKTIASSSYLGLNLFVSAGSDFNSRTGSLGIQSNTFDFWGVQVEYGSKATPFQTATGTIQGELAACQRYYVRITSNANYSNMSTFAPAVSTTVVDCPIPLTVPLRTYPTTVETSNIMVEDAVNAGLSSGTWSISGSVYSTQVPAVRYTHGSAALTQYRSYHICGNNNSSAYLGLSAEL